jgi:ribosomal-protein-alanine N-acetyltransferase
MPGGAGGQRAVSYFTDNREHLAPWEPPFPDSMFQRVFWERRLEQDLVDYRGGRSLRLVLLARDDPGGPILGFCNFTQFVRGAFMACTLG